MVIASVKAVTPTFSGVLSRLLVSLALPTAYRLAHRTEHTSTEFQCYSFHSSSPAEFQPSQLRDGDTSHIPNNASGHLASEQFAQPRDETAFQESVQFRDMQEYRRQANVTSHLIGRRPASANVTARKFIIANMLGTFWRRKAFSWTHT